MTLCDWNDIVEDRYGGEHERFCQELAVTHDAESDQDLCVTHSPEA